MAATPEDFHPDLRRIARVLPRNAFNRLTVPMIRRFTRMRAAREHEGVEIVTLPGSAGVTVRIHRPRSDDSKRAALLWIHGGGYVIGSAAQDDRLCHRFATQLNTVVAAVDYRLAPTHPYPAAVDDCYQALTWLSRLPEVDASRVAIGGASAGGGLAAALALRARDFGELAPLFQLLVYPMVDDRPHGSAGIKNRHYRVWSPKTNRLGWSAYLRGADPQIAVPARNQDLSGLPPAWIGVGTLDPLHDQSVEYSQRLQYSGVPCELVTVPGAFHGFDLVAPKAEVSVKFFDDQLRALRNALQA